MDGYVTKRRRPRYVTCCAGCFEELAKNKTLYRSRKYKSGDVRQKCSVCEQYLYCDVYEVYDQPEGKIG